LSIFNTTSKEAVGMKRIYASIIPLFLVVSLISFQGFATEQVPFKIEKSLPQDRLAYYNDSFDKFREDLWEKAALTWAREQLADYKLADITIKNGQLIIKTKTGGFSQGGLGSKYILRGDFDVQLDCHIDFLRRRQDIDQYLFFFVATAEAKGKTDRSVVNMGVVKKAGHRKGVIFSRHRIKDEKFPASKGSRIGKFHGTLRLVRTGKRMRTLFKKEGEGLWRELSNFAFPPDDMRLGFSLQNFISKRTSVKASASVIARFDNFKINAAQEMIEEEI
jgi:hypothetical protein